MMNNSAIVETFIVFLVAFYYLINNVCFHLITIMIDHVKMWHIFTDVCRICLVFLFTTNVDIMEITFRITTGISYIHNIISKWSFESIKVTGLSDCEKKNTISKNIWFKCIKCILYELQLRNFSV